MTIPDTADYPPADGQLGSFELGQWCRTHGRALVYHEGRREWSCVDCQGTMRVEAMNLREARWTPSMNEAAKSILEDVDAVLVTVTYDDGSQVVFRRAASEGSRG